VSEKTTIAALSRKALEVKTAPMFGNPSKADQIESAWMLLLAYLIEQEQHLAEQDARISELERMVKDGKG
jgi:hypothetical protein